MNSSALDTVRWFTPRALATIGVAVVVYWSVFSSRPTSDDPQVAQPESSAPIPIVPPITQLTDGLWSFGDSPWRIGANEIDDYDHARKRLMDASDLPLPVVGDRSHSDTILELVEQFNPVTEVMGPIKRRTVATAGLQMAMFTGTADDFRVLRVLAGSESPYLLFTVSVPHLPPPIPVHESPDQDWALSIPGDATVVATRHDSVGGTLAKFLLTPEQPLSMIELWKRQGWSVDAKKETSNIWQLRRGQHTYSITRGDSPDGRSALIVMKIL